MAAARTPRPGFGAAVGVRVEQLEARWFLSAGGLDRNFGTNGYVLTSIHAAAGTVGYDGSDIASAATDNTTGKLIVAGSVDGNAGFAVVRYNTNGSRDITFGQGGQSLLNFGADNLAMATSVAVQRDERILVGGTASLDGSLSAVIARLTRTGQPDAAFGDNGIVNAQPDSTVFAYSAVVKIAVDPDGGIVAAGRAGDASETNEDWVIWRFTADGQPDSSFGTDGRTVIDLGGLDQPLDMTIAPDGGIVVAGTSQRATEFDEPMRHSGFWLARLTSDGQPDPSFGNNGILQSEISQTVFAARVALDPGGDIVVAGPIIPGSTPSATSPQVAIGRFNYDGTTDTSFGSNGVTITSGISTVLGLKVANDHSTILAGFAPVLNAAGKESGTATLFAHYQSNGLPDTRFAAKGVVSIRHSTSARLNRNALFAADGSIVLVGAGKTYSQQGRSCYGFLSARFKADRADSKPGIITTIPNVKPMSANVAATGTLSVRGTGESDTIVFSMIPGRVPSVRVVVNDQAKIFSIKGVKGIRIDALGGDDYVSLGDVKLAAEVHGGDGNDTLLGGMGTCRLFGENGNDSLSSGPGLRDSLYGGSGDDVFSPGAGGDTADGGSGTDRIDHTSNPWKFTKMKGIELR